MPRRTFFTVTPVAALFVAASAGSAATDEECRMFRILDDGTRIAVSSIDGAASASASSTGRSASSSVSVSSSSHGGGSSHVSSSAHVDGKGRTVTTTHDENGCTITVDGRSTNGDGQ